MKDKVEKFITDYLTVASPTGYEVAGQKLWLEYLKPFIDDYKVDNYGSVVAIINPDAPYKVVIEAHADEISWFVNYITPEGYIYVIRNGGSDPVIAPSKRVNIHTEKGIVKAVFGWPAIHVRKEKDEMPTIKNIFLDCGCSSKEEVENLGIHVGCVVTFEDEPMILNNKYWVGRGLDNRLGGFTIAEVARKIRKNKKKLPFGLYVVNSVQEEVGLQGARMVADWLKPDVALIVDVCHDTKSPMYNKQMEGEIIAGSGPAVSYAPSVHNNVLKMLIQTAQDNKIPFQRMASSRSTGTDTDAFAYSNGGVPSGLVSIPLKYMHTTVEMGNIEDIKNSIRLIYNFLLQLEAGHDFRYFK